MGPPSYMRSVVDRNVVVRRKTVFRSRILLFASTHKGRPAGCRSANNRQGQAHTPQ